MSSTPVSDSVAMTMHEATEITVRIGKPPNHIQVELVFTFPPTQQIAIEAMRHFLTDQEFLDGVALHFMQAIQEIPLPRRQDFNEKEINGKTTSVWNLPLLFFQSI